MDFIRKSKITNVQMVNKYKSSSNSNSQKDLIGTIYLTATHLIFMENNGEYETWILHSHLLNISKRPISVSGTPIHIRCKNFQTVTFIIPKERDAHDLYISLYQISQPINLTDLYCFYYTASREPFQNKREYGWNKFCLLKEFERQGIQNSSWCLTNINKNYEVCETYPSVLFVPKSTTVHMLKASAKFRSKQRFPVLSFFYNKNNAAICRCSQPLSGLSQRSLEDENLLNCILHSNTLNKDEKFLYVVDTRPMINAIANRASGKGYENKNFYENIKFFFFGIENIHVMRGSLQKVIETCELKIPSIAAFFSGINASGWLKHIRIILETASFVSKTIRSGISVVIHCSDGWDRTSQTCSLASLLLDPYYRTINGFQSLIEKEWISFGHKFTDRCGYILIGDSKEIAPIFTQFIDSVWQITQQFPFEFEFNEKFLLILHDHVYSCQFGTFIGNCEKERKQMNVKNLTYSLWALIESQNEQFINPLYKYRKMNNENDFLNILLSPQLIRFWRSMYNRFDLGVHPREQINDLLNVTYNHTKSLEAHICFLKQKLNQMQLFKEKKLNIKLFESELDSNEIKNNINKNSMQLSSFDSSLKKMQDYIDKLQTKNNNQLENKDSYNCLLNNDQNEKSLLEFKNLFEINLIELVNCMQSIALDWQSFRDAKQCLCGYYFEQNNQILHCWCCGKIYCIRCIKKRIQLPGHNYTKLNVEHLSPKIITYKDEMENNPLKVPNKEDKTEENLFYDYVPICVNCYKKLIKIN